jgi:hypothetical protein
MNDQWFVSNDGQQLGPYTGEQLVGFAQQGNILPDTLVWTEGMAEWAAASQIPGLFPAASPVAAAAPVQAATAPASAAWNPNANRGLSAAAVAPKTLYAAVAPVGGDYPFFKVNPSSFGLWLGTFIGGLVLIIIAMISMAAAGAAAMAIAASGGTEAETVAAGAGGVGLGLLLFFLALGINLFSAILFYIYLYRAWFCLQPGGAQTSPGKAVGFLFIPLFNIYWIFVAINGLPKDWNRVVSSYPNLAGAPKLNETAFLLVCIGMFFPPLALVMIFPMMSQMCKAINFFASRRDPNASTSAFARPSFGGLR